MGEDSQLPPSKLLSGVDWGAVLYAFCVALALGIFVTWRARNIQRQLGKPLSPWTTAIPDAFIGGFIGTIFSLIAPSIYKPFDSFAGVNVAAGIRAIMGPLITDALQDRGVDMFWAWVGSKSEALATAINSKNKSKGLNNDNSSQAGDTDAISKK